MAGLFLTACGPTQPKTFTIGVVNLSPAVNAVFDGFKAGMAELDYVEGKNVTYIYEGATGSIDGLEAAIQNLIAADVDLILAITTPAAQKTKQAVEGTDIPVVFGPVNDPVQSGIVSSLTKPGGNLTGIRVGGFIPKELEWLLVTAPGTTRIFVLHNPDDASSVQGLEVLNEAATRLGVEIVVHEVRTSEEIIAAVAVIPDEVEAIFFLPDNLVLAHIDGFAEVALERNLPLASVSFSQAEAGALLAYGPEFFPVGEQTARLADQILKGTKPGDLPVETAEFFLTINLQTATAIGLDVSDEILRQADNVIR